jgi:hypothetical protein
MTNESAIPAASPVVHSAGDATALNEGPAKPSSYGAQPDEQDTSAVSASPVAAPPAEMPKGYALAPVVPTLRMIQEGAAAARRYMEETGGNSPSAIYCAMIAAAPAAALSPVAAPLPAEPTRLPYDVKVGAATFRKGVALDTFIEAARRWHREAFPDYYTLTDEQKAANLAILQGAATPVPQQAAPLSEGELPARPLAIGRFHHFPADESLPEGDWEWFDRNIECNECVDAVILRQSDYDALVFAAAPQGQPAPDLAGVLEALEMARTGLQWYRGMMPEYVDGSDAEADEQIDAAIALLKGTP